MTETEYYKLRDRISQFLLNLTPMQLDWLNRVVPNVRAAGDVRQVCDNLFRDAARNGIQKTVAHTLIFAATKACGAAIAPKTLGWLRDRAYPAPII